MRGRTGACALLFCLSVALPVWAGESEPPPQVLAATVNLMLSPQAKGPKPPEGRLHLRPLLAAGEPLSVAVKEGAPSIAKVPGDSLWEVSAELPGWWAKPTTLRVPAEAVEHLELLRVWPVAYLAGRLALPPSSTSAPKELVLAFGDLGGRAASAATPHASLNCPVSDRLEFRCAVPAARLDAAVRVKGFAPHYRWGLQLAAGKTQDLGRLPLKVGASLVGRVETEDGSRPSGLGVARLLPLQAPGPGAAQAKRLQATAAEASVREDGFFQLTDLRPGTYLLEVTSPGYAPARVSPAQVEASLETTVAFPVVLRRPIRLEIVLTPARDWLDRPWQVTLHGTSASTGEVKGKPAYHSPASREGLVTLPDQETGRYWVTVADSLGNRLLSEWFDVSGPGDAHQDLAIEVITVEGTVKLGREPLRATLWFGGERGAVSIKMESNEDGEFVGVLPRAGIWQLAVRSDSPAVASHLRLEVAANQLGKAQVEVSLPDTRVFGRVLSEGGRPVPAASVEINTSVWSEKTQADDQGEFSFLGLPEGAAQLAASASIAGEKATTDWTFVTLTDRQEVGPIDLRLRRVKTFKGRVESLQGPVAGATVRVIPSRPLLGFGDQERTLLDGSFEVEIPGASDLLHVIVTSPGLGLKTFEIPASAQPVVLFLAEHKGTVNVEVPFSDDEAAERNLRLLVFQNGVPLSSSDLSAWARAQGVRPHEGKSFVFPSLAPGSYRACMMPRSAVPELAFSGWSGSEAACASGELGSNDELSLVLPKPASG